MPVTFYSKTPGLKCWAGKSEYKSVDGTLRMMDPPLVTFTPIAKASPDAQQYGYFTTDDPDVIAYLENRIKAGGDVVGEEEFAKNSVPAEMRAKLLEEKVRELENKNRLLEQVKAQEVVAKPLPKPRQE